MHERACLIATWGGVLVIAFVFGCGGSGTENTAKSVGGSGTGGGALAGNESSEEAAGMAHDAGGSATTSGGAAQGGSSVTSAGASTAGAAGTPNLYVDLLRTGSPSLCLPRPLPIGMAETAEAGRAACSVGELHFTSCDCSKPGLAPLSEQLLSAFLATAKQLAACDGSASPACATACGCEIIQPAGTSADAQSALYACENQLTPPAEVAGFCVVDATGPTLVGNPELVASCPSSSRRRLRFVGPELPDTSATTFIACASTPAGD